MSKGIRLGSTVLFSVDFRCDHHRPATAADPSRGCANQNGRDRGGQKSYRLFTERNMKALPEESTTFPGFS